MAGWAVDRAHSDRIFPSPCQYVNRDFIELARLALFSETDGRVPRPASRGCGPGSGKSAARPPVCERRVKGLGHAMRRAVCGAGTAPTLPASESRGHEQSMGIGAARITYTGQTPERRRQNHLPAGWWPHRARTLVRQAPTQARSRTREGKHRRRTRKQPQRRLRRPYRAGGAESAVAMI